MARAGHAIPLPEPVLFPRRTALLPNVNHATHPTPIARDRRCIGASLLSVVLLPSTVTSVRAAFIGALVVVVTRAPDVRAHTPHTFASWSENNGM